MTFFIIFLSVMIALNYYSYRRFFRQLSPSFSRYSAIIPLILILGNILFVVNLTTDFIPDSPALYFISSSFIGLSFIIFIIAVAYDLTITLSRKVPFDKERRKSIKIIFDFTMLISAFSYIFHGFLQGLKQPDINHVKINIRNFPSDDYTIVQISDIHVGPTIRHAFIEKMVERINALSADLLVITGDLVDANIEKIKHDLEPLRYLNADCYFILGNHEYFHGVTDTVEHLKHMGIKTLLNDCLKININDKSFNLVGLTDLVGERMNTLAPDANRAFSTVDNKSPTIVLAHQPKMIEQMSDKTFDLMLSGHTHGGQIFPFGFLVMMHQPYLAGLHQHDTNKQIFVSRGTGYWGPPIRVLAPSEISVLHISNS